jgi:hypothetical protein
MSAQGIGLGFVVVGAGIWFLAYFNHDTGSGSIRAPDAVRRLVRRGDGSVRVSSVASEVLAFLLALTGIVVAADAVPPNAILMVGAPATFVVIGLDAALSFRDRRRGDRT